MGAAGQFVVFRLALGAAIPVSVASMKSLTSADV